MDEKTITLTKHERDFMYNQIMARKQYFEKEMYEWAEVKDTKEMMRCAEGVSKCANIMNKILNS